MLPPNPALEAADLTTLGTLPQALGRIRGDRGNHLTQVHHCTKYPTLTGARDGLYKDPIGCATTQAFALHLPLTPSPGPIRHRLRLEQACLTLPRLLPTNWAVSCMQT